MSQSEKYTRLIKDTFVFALGNLGSKLILFFLVPLYTNYLTTEEYGTADLVFTISQFLVPIFSVVIFDAVIRFGQQLWWHMYNCVKENTSAFKYTDFSLSVWRMGTVEFEICHDLLDDHNWSDPARRLYYD